MSEKSLIQAQANAPEERLPLITLREARAAVELLQLLCAQGGEAADVAGDLAAALARRLPSD
ncbi:hypothetical protein ABT112_27020 [Streptomyces sp. NPDC002055]|uniref:hypothetical protein n=1 Tax=Streptomyces sp. NPDC002055 TaxID=3154534 RepID=UPI00332701B8